MLHCISIASYIITSRLSPPSKVGNDSQDFPANVSLIASTLGRDVGGDRDVPWPYK